MLKAILELGTKVARISLIITIIIIPQHSVIATSNPMGHVRVFVLAQVTGRHGQQRRTSIVVKGWKQPVATTLAVA